MPTGLCERLESRSIPRRAERGALGSARGQPLDGSSARRRRAGRMCISYQDRLREVSAAPHSGAQHIQPPHKVYNMLLKICFYAHAMTQADRITSRITCSFGRRQARPVFASAAVGAARPGASPSPEIPPRPGADTESESER